MHGPAGDRRNPEISRTVPCQGSFPRLFTRRRWQRTYTLLITAVRNFPSPSLAYPFVQKLPELEVREHAPVRIRTGVLNTSLKARRKIISHREENVTRQTPDVQLPLLLLSKDSYKKLQLHLRMTSPRLCPTIARRKGRTTPWSFSLAKLLVTVSGTRWSICTWLRSLYELRCYIHAAVCGQ